MTVLYLILLCGSLMIFFCNFQAFFMGIIRLVVSVYSFSHHRIAAEGEKKRKRLVENTPKKDSWDLHS